MRNYKVYATQGGGYAQIIGEHAYFIQELDVPGKYHFNIGDMVPDEWDLALVTNPEECLNENIPN